MPERRLQDLAACQEVPPAMTVLLIDILYQLEPPVQMGLLHAAVRASRQRIIIRTPDPDLGIRSSLTIWLEKRLRWVSPHSGRYVAACMLLLSGRATILIPAGEP